MVRRFGCFLATIALAACGASLAYAANTIFINANVITVDPAHPAAQAFAFEYGRFIADGTNAQILKLKGPSSQVIDLHGMTVTPGFNDAHLHPQAIFDENSPYYRVWLGADKVKTMDELVAALKRKAGITPPAGTINGYGYNDVTLGRHPNRHDLDKVSTTEPVMITHGSGHITVVNSYVLNEAGITKDTTDPPGGAFDRDPDGTPNGVLREAARGVLERGRRDHGGNGSDRQKMPHDVELQGYMNCFKQYSAKGLTSVGVAGGSPTSSRLFQELRDEGNPVRVGLMIYSQYYDQIAAAGIERGFGDDRLRITAIKNFQGNSLSGRTAGSAKPTQTGPAISAFRPREARSTGRRFPEMVGRGLAGCHALQWRPRNRHGAHRH